MNDPKLHVYSSSYFHQPAFIVGNKAALEELRSAIEVALAKSSGSATASTADGEGFEVKVYCEEEEAYWNKAELPYTDKTIFVGGDDDIGPWDLFRKHKDD